MTKEKWETLYLESLDKHLGKFGNDFNPTSWYKVKEDLNNFIKEVDEATSVFEMENNNGNG